MSVVSAIPGTTPSSRTKGRAWKRSLSGTARILGGAPEHRPV
jgi:hypothetical protein